MATDFTQDTVLHFIRSGGGSVKNSDLLAHFRNFIREHPNRDRNRELFKTFVNSVATVQQLDGVSYVVLRKKFRGRVPGHGERGSSGPLRGPAGANTQTSAVNASPNPTGRAKKPRQKVQPEEVPRPAVPGAIVGKSLLPAAGIIHNVQPNSNLQQAPKTSGVSVRPAEAQVASHISENTHIKTPPLSESFAQDPHTKGAQPSLGLGPPPGITPVITAVRRPVELSEQGPTPELLRGRHVRLQSAEDLHQGPPPPPSSLHPQVVQRRIRHRQSYKAALSYDDEEEEEEEETPVRRGSAGVMPQSAPLGTMGRVISASSPCIIDQPAPPSVVSSSSAERKVPEIYIQDMKQEMASTGGPDPSLEPELGHRGHGPRAGLQPGEPTSTRRSLPIEAERCLHSAAQGKDAAPHHYGHGDHRYLQPAGDHSGRPRLSSSYSSSPAASPAADISSGLRWNSSNEDLQARPESAALSKTRGGTQIQEVLQRAQKTQSESVPHHVSRENRAPWHHSSDNLQQEQARVAPWHHSTGNLYDDHEETESSDGSIFTPPRRQRPAVARRLSSQLRNRMCLSLGADLDQLLQEEERGGRGGGNEVARLNRLHMISSSLSLRHGISSSSLSSCSTPPRSQSFADLVEGVEGKGERRILPASLSPSSAVHREEPNRQSLVPLEPREHAWLVKGAAGAWPDIYALFREDSSLLNRRDFISGFTVLHWIAKHGDHRVLNTLWYGVQKAGLNFDVNARSTSGHTPLHIAAIHNSKNIIRLLVSKFGADVKLRDTAGKKAWQYLSRTASSDVFQLLGAPALGRAAGRGEGGARRAGKEQQQQRRRLRHHFSSASSGERPVISGTAKVKRSTSLAAFLKHKSLQRFHGHQSDSSV